MTREEAIEVLNGIEEVYGALPEDGNKIEEALSMAIKALEQEPCEDAISRSAAIKAIDERAKRIKNEDTLNGLAGAVGVLFNLPPVKPQYTDDEIQAEWEYNKDALAEIACRELARLGIVRAKGDEWELVEPQENGVCGMISDKLTIDDGEPDGTGGQIFCP